MPQFGASLTDDARAVIDDCNLFIIQATDIIKSYKQILEWPEKDLHKQAHLLIGWRSLP
jgi:hypothetical protein